MKKIIIVIVILVLIGGGILFLTRQAKPSLEGGNGQKSTEIDQGTKAETTEPTESEPVIDPLVSLKSRLGPQARSFIERYGSYSSDSNWENLKGLLGMMSQKLRVATQAQIAQDLIGEKGFYGLTTKVISMELKDFDLENLAKFLASVQQRETKGNLTNSLFKTVELIFIKEGGEWRVDEISFKP